MGDWPVSTTAITIDAPPEDVWRWLVQMGPGAGRLLHPRRGRTPSVHHLRRRPRSTRIQPEGQELHVGDRVPYSRLNTVLVVLVDRPHALWAGERLVLEPPSVQSRR